MTGEQAAFGSALRREREGREISLPAVAESTKIKQSLLASLERGDASHWPPGIYGRAFLREYAAAVGLPPEPIVAEFLRLFSEAGAGVPERIDPSNAIGGLRLTLAQARRWQAGTLATQAAAALIDLGIVLAIGAAMGNRFDLATWTTTAIFAVAYYSVATTSLGRSPMLWLINLAVLRHADRAKARVRPRPSSRDLLHIVGNAPRQVQPPGERELTPVVEKARIASR